jgi:hypothetical protein
MVRGRNRNEGIKRLLVVLATGTLPCVSIVVVHEFIVKASSALNPLARLAGNGVGFPFLQFW